MVRRLREPWLFVVAAMALLAAINFGYRVIVGTLNEELDTQLGEQLGGLAETFAGSLDVGTVSLAAGSETNFDADSYMSLRQQAQQFAANNRLVSATILDTTWQDIFASEADSLGVAIYGLLDREGQWAVHTGMAWVSETFRWGDSYYRSAASPVIDPRSGVLIAIARVEADARYLASLGRLRRLAWWIHGLSAVLAAALLGLFMWYGRVTRSWETELLRSEKLIGLGRLAATVAHEIKNPLGIIKATAQRLERLEGLDPAKDAKRAELLRFIPEEVDRLNRILMRYLQAGTQTLSHPTAVNIGQELPGWLRAIEDRPEQPGRFKLEIEKTGPIRADADSPRQIVLNLVRNALEACGPEGAVEIVWRRDGDSFGMLRVGDHGPGIPKSLRREVFEPFYTTKATGTGLGLYTVKALVERDGGDVSVEENQGGGALFVVRWPLAK